MYGVSGFTSSSEDGLATDEFGDEFAYLRRLLDFPATSQEKGDGTLPGPQEQQQFPAPAAEMATIASVPALVVPQVQVAAQGSHALRESPPSDSGRQTQGTMLTPPLNAPCPPADNRSCARCRKIFKTSQARANHERRKNNPCVPPMTPSQSSLAPQTSAGSGLPPDQPSDRQLPPANGLHNQHPQHLLQPIGTAHGNAAAPALHNAPPVGFAAQMPGWTYAQLGSPMAVLHHLAPDDPAMLSLFIAPEVGPFTITLQGKGQNIISKDSTELSRQSDGSYHVTAVHPYHLQQSASSDVKALLVQVHTARHGTIYQQKISYSSQAFAMKASAEAQDPPACDSEKEEESVSVCRDCYQQMTAYGEKEDTMEQEEPPTPVEDAQEGGVMICWDCFQQLCEFDQQSQSNSNQSCKSEPSQPDEYQELEARPSAVGYHSSGNVPRAHDLGTQMKKEPTSPSTSTAPPPPSQAELTKEETQFYEAVYKRMTPLQRTVSECIVQSGGSCHFENILYTVKKKWADIKNEDELPWMINLRDVVGACVTQDRGEASNALFMSDSESSCWKLGLSNPFAKTSGLALSPEEQGIPLAVSFMQGSGSEDKGSSRPNVPLTLLQKAKLAIDAITANGEATDLMSIWAYTEKARAQQQKLHMAEQDQLIKDQADNNEDNDNLCTPSFGQVRLKSPNGNPALGSAKKRRRIADVKEQDEGSKPLQANQPKLSPSWHRLLKRDLCYSKES